VVVVALDGDSLLALGPGLQNLAPWQRLNFTIDGFEAPPEMAMALLSAGAADVAPHSVTVHENVIFDTESNDRNGLTCAQTCKFKDIQRKTEQFYGKVGIQFVVTYTDGQIVWSMGGNHIVDILGVKGGQLNVFVFGGNLPLAISGPWGDATGASYITSLQDHKFAVTYIGLLNASASTLEHEFAHHFMGQTLHPGWLFPFINNVYNDIVVNWFVLPHPTGYGTTLRKYSQVVLNP
jgi:hypothetical protein